MATAITPEQQALLMLILTWNNQGKFFIDSWRRILTFLTGEERDYANALILAWEEAVACSPSSCCSYS